MKNLEDSLKAVVHKYGCLPQYSISLGDAVNYENDSAPDSPLPLRTLCATINETILSYTVYDEKSSLSLVGIDDDSTVELNIQDVSEGTLAVSGFFTPYTNPRIATMVRQTHRTEMFKRTFVERGGKYILALGRHSSDHKILFHSPRYKITDLMRAAQAFIDANYR